MVDILKCCNHGRRMNQSQKGTCEQKRKENRLRED
jgi:hypothetical protein